MHKQTYQERTGGLTAEIRQKMSVALFVLLMTASDGKLSVFRYRSRRVPTMAGTRVWRISAGGPPGRSGYVPLCVPEGQLVSSGQIGPGMHNGEDGRPARNRQRRDNTPERFNPASRCRDHNNLHHAALTLLRRTVFL